MNWNELLRLPSVILWGAAAVVLVLTLWQLGAVVRRVRHRRRIAASLHGVVLLVLLALGLLLAGAGTMLRGYHFMAQEQQLMNLDARFLVKQRWAVTLTLANGSTRQEQLAGDDFRVEAVVLKWKLPAVLAGVPPLYRLDRLEGRYADPRQETVAPRSVLAFAMPSDLDLLSVRRQYPQWLPMVDVVYGSGAYLPLVDGGHYTISLMNTGALVARPDAATRQRIDAGR